MKTTLLSWGLLLALVVGVAPQGLAQTKEPTRKAQKEYQKALEAYRFMSPNLALSFTRTCRIRSKRRRLLRH